MSAPGLVWESGVTEELEAGGIMSFVGVGTEDPEDPRGDEVISWLVLFDMPNGERKILIKRFVYEPRMFKTYNGISAFAREHCPDWASITLPLYPSIRTVKDAWALIQAAPDGARGVAGPEPKAKRDRPVGSTKPKASKVAAKPKAATGGARQKTVRAARPRQQE